MLLEHASIRVRAGSAAAFESAMADARGAIAGSPGFVSFSLRRGVESPDTYLLLVGWETLDDHLVGFRESEAFTRWRALIGPYFDGQPVVDHYEVVEGLT
jgi:heme-degrading monooxygenase HmoA